MEKAFALVDIFSVPKVLRWYLLNCDAIVIGGSQTIVSGIGHTWAGSSIPQCVSATSHS
jgi:hypothetical protein